MARKRRPPLTKSATRVSAKALDEAVDQIVQEMEIPTVEYAWAEARSAVELFIERNNDGALGADPNTYMLIAQLAHELLTNLHKLNSSDQRFFAEAMGFAVESLERYLEAIARTAESLRPNKRPHNRPPGTYKYPLIRALVRDLDRIGFAVDGKLTLGQNTEKLNGALPRILKILHQLVPTFVPAPAEMSYATLRRMRLSFDEWDAEMRDYYLLFSDEDCSDGCQAESA